MSVWRMLPSIRPRHSFAAVLQELIRGLNDGSIVLPVSPGNRQTPIVAENATTTGANPAPRLIVAKSVGGGLTAVVGSIAYEVFMRDVTFYNTLVDQCVSINAELVSALKQGRQAIEGIPLDADEKEELLFTFGKLTAELAKPKPEPTIIRMFSNTIARFAAKAPPLAQIRALLDQGLGTAMLPDVPADVPLHD